MSSLKAKDRVVLEKFLEMGGGYVCNFSDRTFQDFVLESTEVDVYAPGYEAEGTSKANRLRTFWKRESNSLTTTLIRELIDYWRIQKINSGSFDLKIDQMYQECAKIVARLKSENPIEDLDALKIDTTDVSFNILAASMRANILSGGEVNQDLDHLHTLMMKRMRGLCDKHGLVYEKETRLDKLFREYVGYLRKNELIEAKMSERIFVSLGSILNSFDTVRNDHSFAHDNPILNLEESVLIFSTAMSILKLIEVKEVKLAKDGETAREKNDEDQAHFTDEEIEAAADAYIQYEIDFRRGK